VASETVHTELQELLGYGFGDAALLTRALTHRSFANENPEGGRDNERLEFLGDAVIGLVVGHELIDRFPDSAEGELSVLRSRIVSERGLSAAARKLDLGRWLRLGKGEERTGGRDKSSLLADVFEAVVGAVYLDGGYVPARELVVQALAEALEEPAHATLDYKTRLQEFAQGKFKSTPTYEVVSSSGPDHDKVFEVRVVIGEDELGRASGRSKKAAEQAAAGAALAAISDRGRF
jgi:ribonuclease-3